MSELLDSLWDRFGSLRVEDIPGEVLLVAHHSVLDWFGCALAGSREPSIEILCKELAEAEGNCSIVGRAVRADVYRAALVNGTAGHALDYDDSNPVMGGHPTAPVWPAVLSLAESEHFSGADALAAFVVGLEVEARIGRAIGPEHYQKGWHVTSTIGVFGAAAAASRLLGLDHDRFGTAIGIAASNASGLKANFGTMTKPLHIGHAAERGLLAARLASKGFTANPEALDAEQGLAQAAGSGALDSRQLDRWDDDWTALRTLFKFHAACHLTHAGIEATSSLVEQGVAVADIETIALTVNPAIIDVCGIPDPSTGLEAKFSLRGTQALLLSGFDTAAVETFTDDPINRSEVRAILDRVSLVTDADRPMLSIRSSVTTARGTSVAECDVSRPDPDLGRQGQRVNAKFLALAAPVIGADEAVRLAELLSNLRLVGDVAELMTRMR